MRAGSTLFILSVITEARAAPGGTRCSAKFSDLASVSTGQDATISTNVSHTVSVESRSQYISESTTVVVETTIATLTEVVATESTAMYGTPSSSSTDNVAQAEATDPSIGEILVVETASDHSGVSSERPTAVPKEGSVISTPTSMTASTDVSDMALPAAIPSSESSFSDSSVVPAEPSVISVPPPLSSTELSSSATTSGNSAVETGTTASSDNPTDPAITEDQAASMSDGKSHQVGVGINYQTGDLGPLVGWNSLLGWYYDWMLEPSVPVSPDYGLNYVPMIWGLEQAEVFSFGDWKVPESWVQGNVTHLLGFYERKYSQI